MSQIEIPDWVVEGACKNAWPEFRSGMETAIWEFADAARRDRLRQIVRAALRAALEGWLVPAGKVIGVSHFKEHLCTVVSPADGQVAYMHDDVFTIRKEPAA